ncbi:CapA family protein [Priestia abyssalis]|uniref:CapA family protein n=1 Tax=Priestia abyssalis TaxID=1221450 RepID=UPI001117A32B|nr:CapA family protein [Priestia abyssalis]
MNRIKNRKRKRKRQEKQFWRLLGALLSLLVALIAINVYYLGPSEQKAVSKPVAENVLIESDLPEKENYLDPKWIMEEEDLHEPITLAFAGDVLLDSGVGKDIEVHGVSYPFKHVASLLAQADLAAVNLETPVSKRGTPFQKQFAFRSRPETLQGIVDAGIDVVSLANNHTLDYGEEALLDTIDHLKAYRIGYTGAGKNEEEAFTAHYKIIKGKKVAILGLSRVLPNVSWFAKKDRAGIANAYHEEPMMEYVKKAVQSSDYTVVMIHWNKELADYPEEYAKAMARQFIDAGVTAVIGSHSHSLMGIEYYKGSPIYYSLGNFVFTNSSVPKGRETVIAHITLDNGAVSSSLTPLKIAAHQPVPMDQAYNEQLIQKLNNLSYNVQIDKKGNVSLKE